MTFRVKPLNEFQGPTDDLLRFFVSFSFCIDIISWDVRYLGKPDKRYLVRRILDLHRAVVCFIQESKFETANWAIRGIVKGSRLDSKCFSPSPGSSIRMIIGWNSSFFRGSPIFYGQFFLIVEFTNTVDHGSWLCIFVYGPNDRHLKQAFWNEIHISHGGHSALWLICGDFKAIFISLKKIRVSQTTMISPKHNLF